MRRRVCEGRARRRVHESSELGESVLHIAKYERPASVEEALALIRRNKAARVIGGGAWLRLQERRLGCAIDLSACGLDRIEHVSWETGEAADEGAERADGAAAEPTAGADALPGDAWSVGAMVTLHQLERHAGFNASTCGVFERAVRDIVGVQMRNIATMGGTLYGRFGFSDVLCALLPLDCEVELAGEGRVPLVEFAARKTYERDIVVRLIVRDHADLRASFQAVRRSATDFPVLNACAARWDGAWRVAVGARPARARLLQGDELGLPAAFTEAELDAACERASALPMSDNLRGSARYRRALAAALARRAVLEAAGLRGKGTGGAGPAADAPSAGPAADAPGAGPADAARPVPAPTPSTAPQKGGEA